MPRLDRMQIYAYSTLTVKNEERYLRTYVLYLKVFPYTGYSTRTVHVLYVYICTRSATSSVSDGSFLVGLALQYVYAF